MPKSLDPNFRLTLVLASDADKPEATQPRIFAKTLSIAALSTVQSLRQNKEPERLIDALMFALTGWENMIDHDGSEIPFSRDNLARILDIDEVIEVIEFLVGAGRLDSDERKKSE